MLYQVLDFEEATEVLKLAGIKLSDFKADDPMHSETYGQDLDVVTRRYFVVVSVRPDNRFEQIKLLFNATFRGYGILLIQPFPYPLAMWKRILRPIIIVMNMGEEYIQFIDSDYWEVFSKGLSSVFEG